MPWVRRTRTCRPTSCSATPTATTTAGRRCGRAAGCRPSSRGPRSSRAARPSSTCIPPSPCPKAIQRNNLEALARLNEERRKLYPHESELDARIRNYELAARMQLSAEEVLRIDGETAATRRLYGLDDPVTENFGTRCLMARRLVESGVRFVQVMVPVKIGRQCPGTITRRSRAAWRRSARRSTARRRP